MRLGVAISVFNKFDFVKINLEIFKKVWKTHPYVSICCNHKETYDKLKKFENQEITVVLGEDMPVNSKKDLRRRQHDCIKKSINQCLDKTDYVVHWHADAFALDESSIVELINTMKLKDYKFAGRGLWKKYKSSKVPEGDLDDHFFILDSKTFVDLDIFSEKNAKTVNNLIESEVCSEGILSYLINLHLPEDKIFIYSDFSECEVLKSDKTDSRYKDNIAHRTLPPVNFDPVRKFLHCDQIDKINDFFSKSNIKFSIFDFGIINDKF